MFLPRSAAVLWRMPSNRPGMVAGRPNKGSPPLTGPVLYLTASCTEDRWSTLVQLEPIRTALLRAANAVGPRLPPRAGVSRRFLTD